MAMTIYGNPVLYVIYSSVGTSALYKYASGISDSGFKATMECLKIDQ